MCYFDYYLYFTLELYYLIFHLVYYVYFFLQSNHIKSLIKIQSFYNYIYNFEKYYSKARLKSPISIPPQKL